MHRLQRPLGQDLPESRGPFTALDDVLQGLQQLPPIRHDQHLIVVPLLPSDPLGLVSIQEGAFRARVPQLTEAGKEPGGHATGSRDDFETHLDFSRGSSVQ